MQSKYQRKSLAMSLVLISSVLCSAAFAGGPVVPNQHSSVAKALVVPPHVNYIYFSGLVGVAIPMGNYSKTPAQAGLGAGVGFDIAGAIGGQYGNFRVEGEVGYARNAVKKKYQSLTLARHYNNLLFMANVYFDIPTGINFKPYIGGGMGGNYLDTVPSTSKDTSLFAAQAIAGFSLKVSQNWVLAVDYRLIGTAADNGSTPEFYNNTANAVFRYAFA